MLLKLLKRWLGWDPDSGLLDFSELQQRAPTRPTPPTPPKATGPSAPRPPQSAAPQPSPPRPKTKRAPLDVLDNPRLTLDKPGDDGFDPYNTGAFNRSTSWEKIGRHRKR
jgi:hypothetical protein